MIEVAIIGGGVAGCYCAYRLAGARDGIDVQVFETSTRIGGRLWSVPLKGFSGAPAEIGGMYFKDMHANVGGLVRHLNLETERVHFRRAHQFLRGRYLDDATYVTDRGAVTFALSPPERGKTPADLLAHALDAIVPGCTDAWPIHKAAPRSRRSTFELLRAARHQGRPLHEFSLWNVLAEVVSTEANAVLTSVWGSVALFRNINAFDGVWNLLHEMGEGWGHRLVDGYQRLPEELRARAEAGGAKFQFEHRLIEVSRERNAFRLAFRVGAEGACRVLHAKRLILAIPQRGLQLISLEAAMFDDFKTFERVRDFAVLPTRSCKVFFTFEKPWWNESAISPGALAPADVAAAYTDLPIQQCYYFGARSSSAPALLMAAYADAAGAGFWSPLASAESGDHSNAALGAEDALLLRCPNVLMTSARAQLGVLHHDVPVPAPKSALFFDWGVDPHGGAWHGWAPHFKSWEVRPWMRQPNPSLDLFICGEAYSQRNGWVEGAINSAEKTLERFGLPRPEWINDPDFQFEIDDEGEKQHDERSRRTALRAV